MDVFEEKMKEIFKKVLYLLRPCNTRTITIHSKRLFSSCTYKVSIERLEVRVSAPNRDFFWDYTLATTIGTGKFAIKRQNYYFSTGDFFFLSLFYLFLFVSFGIDLKSVAQGHTIPTNA